MDTGEAAAVEGARRKARRALGLLRDLAGELATLGGDDEVLGVTRAHDSASRRGALDVIDHGIARYGAVDVVVVARPTGRHRRTPTTAPGGAKETMHDEPEHGTQDATDAGARTGGQRRRPVRV